MFLFSWFNVFGHDYRNGFADGFAIGGSFWLLLFICRACYVWRAHVEATRLVIQTFLIEAKYNNINASGIGKFRSCIVNDEILNVPQKAKLFDFCDFLDSYAIRKTNVMELKKDAAISDIQDWLNKTYFPLLKIFFRSPLRNFCFILTHSFGKA